MSVSSLVYTSVQDCKSSLWHYRVKDIDVIRTALELSRKLNEKSRVKLLESKLKQLEKEQKSDAIRQCRAFADKFPIGTTVHYFPKIDKPRFRIFMIRAMPFIGDSWELFVLVRGITGAIPCANIKAPGEEDFFDAA